MIQRNFQVFLDQQIRADRYSLNTHLVPSGILNRINAICRNFLWSGVSEYKKAPNISWTDCCCPKDEGGLGIKDAKSWNKALLGKYVWWLANKKDHLWVRWVSHVYMKDRAWTDYQAPTDCSWSWKKINLIMKTFKQAYINNRWLNSPSEYTVAAGYTWLREKKPLVEWRYLCWNNLNPPKCSFIMWEYLKKRLPTKDRLLKMGLMIDQHCPICSTFPESHDHIMTECVYAKECIRLLQQYLFIKFRIQDLVPWFSAGRKVTKLQKRFIGACHVALLYWIWRIRNEARMDMVVRRPDVIVKMSMDEVKARFLKQNTKPLRIKDQTWFQALGT